MKKKQTVINEIMKNFDFEKAYAIFIKEGFKYYYGVPTLEQFKESAKELLDLLDDDTRQLKGGRFEVEVSGEFDDEILLKFVPFSYCCTK